MAAGQRWGDLPERLHRAFNRGPVAVSVNGWSVQYASAAGTSWAVTVLSGTIQPGQYYLVQQAVGAIRDHSLISQAG